MLARYANPRIPAVGNRGYRSRRAAPSRASFVRAVYGIGWRKGKLCWPEERAMRSFAFSLASACRRHSRRHSSRVITENHRRWDDKTQTTGTMGYMHASFESEAEADKRFGCYREPRTALLAVAVVDERKDAISKRCCSIIGSRFALANRSSNPVCRAIGRISCRYGCRDFTTVPSSRDPSRTSLSVSLSFSLTVPVDSPSDTTIAKP